MADCDAYEYFTENSAFILTLVGLLGAGCSGFAMCVLRSRCSHIKCGCISCERNVLSEQAVAELTTHNANA